MYLSKLMDKLFMTHGQDPVRMRTVHYTLFHYSGGRLPAGADQGQRTDPSPWSGADCLRQWQLHQLHHQHNGKCTVHTPSGKFTVHTPSGKCTVHTLSGKFTVHTPSGKCTVHTPSGKCTVHTSSHPVVNVLSTHPVTQW